MDDDLHPVVGGFVALFAVAVGVFCLYCTYLAFAGGTVPIFGWVLDGSVGTGMLWLCVVTPALTTVGYWIAALIAIPLAAIFRTKS